MQKARLVKLAQSKVLNNVKLVIQAVVNSQTLSSNTNNEYCEIFHGN